MFNPPNKTEYGTMVEALDGQEYNAHQAERHGGLKDRQSADTKAGVKREAAKSGKGGKFTWMGDVGQAREGSFVAHDIDPKVGIGALPRNNNDTAKSEGPLKATAELLTPRMKLDNEKEFPALGGSPPQRKERSMVAKQKEDWAYNIAMDDELKVEYTK